MTKKKKNMGSMLIILLLVVLMLFKFFDQAHAQDEDVIIYMFWGEGCPHCELARPVLKKLADESPQINYLELEVYHQPENLDLFREFADFYGIEPQGVPTIFIGDRYWVGYTENIRMDIETYLDTCLTEACLDPGQEIPSAQKISALLAQENTASTPTDEENSPMWIFLWIIGGAIGIGAIFLLVRGEYIKRSRNKYTYKK